LEQACTGRSGVDCYRRSRKNFFGTERSIVKGLCAPGSGLHALKSVVSSKVALLSNQ
jgi:hypothetical protein